MFTVKGIFTRGESADVCFMPLLRGKGVAGGVSLDISTVSECFPVYGRTHRRLYGVRICAAGHTGERPRLLSAELCRIHQDKYSFLVNLPTSPGSIKYVCSPTEYIL